MCGDSPLIAKTAEPARHSRILTLDGALRSIRFGDAAGLQLFSRSNHPHA
jgi:hypothetical protein